MKYNDQMVEDICKCLAMGATITDTCGYCGISKETYYRWKEDHPEFVERIAKAEATFRMRNIQTIQKASESSWQASAWLLERRCPDDFGRRERQDQHVVIEKLPEIKVTWE